MNTSRSGGSTSTPVPTWCPEGGWPSRRGKEGNRLAAAIRLGVEVTP
jgi:hypothetical protein